MYPLNNQSFENLASDIIYQRVDQTLPVILKFFEEVLIKSECGYIRVHVIYNALL